MNTKLLLDRPVRIRAHDLLTAPATAIVRIIDVASSSMLLELIPPIQIDEVTYSFAVARVRLEHDDLETLLTTGVLGCAVTFVPDGRYNAARPFDLSWWRGGGATVADLVL